MDFATSISESINTEASDDKTGRYGTLTYV